MRQSITQTLVVVVGLPFEARLAGGISGRIICAGNGQSLAASLTFALMNECQGLISLGVAGGLLPNLSAGTCVVGSEILWGTERLITDPGWSQRLLHAIPDSIYGKIVGVDAPIVYAEAKHSLYVTTRAVAVDMESHIVASAAAANGLPFVAIRVIADPAERPLPQVALAAMRPNGTINITQLVRSLMKDPRGLWCLVQSAQDAFAARAKLRRVCNAFGSCQDEHCTTWLKNETTAPRLRTLVTTAARRKRYFATSAKPVCGWKSSKKLVAAGSQQPARRIRRSLLRSKSSFQADVVVGRCPLRS